MSRDAGAVCTSTCPSATGEGTWLLPIYSCVQGSRGDKVYVLSNSPPSNTANCQLKSKELQKEHIPSHVVRSAAIWELRLLLTVEPLGSSLTS